MKFGKTTMFLLVVSGVGLFWTHCAAFPNDDNETTQLADAGPSPKKPAKRARHKKLVVDKATVKHDDGDSFEVGKLTIRVLGVDCPEIIHLDHGISKDQPGGREAAEFTRHLLDGSSKIVLETAGPDHYGRTLAHVWVDGELLSVQLIKAGLGYETVSRYGDSGFPEYAARIQNAASESPEPTFQKPWRWRRKNQVRDR